MWYRLHFTDASLAQLESMGLNQDDLRTVLNAGWKLQVSENRLLVRHHGLEVEVETLGPDYHIQALRRWAEWPRGPPHLKYLEKVGGTS